jgi:two-component system CheB/CheR fusion protein
MYVRHLRGTVKPTSGVIDKQAPTPDLLQAALDALPAHIAILDAAGNIVAVNAAWREFGAENALALAEDGVGSNYLVACRRAVASGDEHATFIVRGMQAVLSGERATFVFDYPCHAPHERRWFAFRIARLRAAGDPRFLVSHENVTPQRLAEEQARTSEARYRAVFSGVGDAILVADEQGHYLDANPAAEDLLGYSREELLTRSASDLVVSDAAWSAEDYAHFLAHGTWRDELELVRKDGQVIPVEAMVTASVLPEGTIHLSAIRDMTRYRKAESQLREELEAREHAEAAKVQLVDAMAHDLGGPLTVIRGQGQLLRRRLIRGEMNPDQLETAISAIEQAVERARLLISDMTDVARLEAGHPLDLHYGSVDLAELTARAVSSFEGASGAALLTMDNSGEPMLGWWDANRITRVLENLLANAIKYSPAGGVVAIRVFYEGEGTETIGIVTISDEGIGIPADDLPHIFERFHRGRNVQGRIAGTGQGLWGSRRIVERHGGTIEIASVEGSGTTVTVRLPLSPDAG